ncbi:MAG: hypothetical protein MH112_04400 [Phenylobacterium sp.]|uniref:hypothetical protein n=1 Tax=Phenylobacterium sp. TaxID=1871053 RepID=UPI0025FB7219|nr:hypothetical protein [Phenylobacterium sp.]MCG9915588.1 hypothetical protein [Phenylobacterium sp.]
MQDDAKVEHQHSSQRFHGVGRKAVGGVLLKHHAMHQRGLNRPKAKAAGLVEVTLYARVVSVPQKLRELEA